MKRKQKNKKYLEEQEQEHNQSSVSLDAERPEPFTKESYQDALKRASRKVSEPEPKEK